MKVIQVCPRFYPDLGGVETHVKELSKHLTQLGVEVEVYTTDPIGNLPKRGRVDGFDIHRFRSYSYNGIYSFSPELFSSLKKISGVDIVHAHDYQDYGVLAAYLSKKKFQKPLVYTPHYHPMGGSKWRTIAKGIYNAVLGGCLFKNADAVIAVSRYEKNLLDQQFHLNSRKLIYIPNGINYEKFSNFKKRVYSNKKQIILYVGRLEKYKGVQFIISALKKIIEVENCELRIIGDGSYKKELINFVEKLGIADHVSFLGKVSESDLIEAYISSDVFVMTSQYEAFCIALAEAMAYALPVIATKVGGMPELIDHGQHGFLIDYPPQRDVLAKTAIYLLENKETARKMGLEGRINILSYSWRSSAEKLLELYKNLLTVYPN